jgi:hypothetical protein
MSSRTQAKVWYHKTPSSILCSKQTCNNEMTCNIFVVGLNQQALQMGWNEPIATNALVEDEAVQAILQMNQKPILFPCPKIF